MFGIKFIACEYDLRGRKTYEGGATYPVRYEYDSDANISRIDYPDATLAFTHDADGLLTSASNSVGVVSNEYDAATGWLVSSRGADGVDVSYTYHLGGGVASISSSVGVVSNTLDVAGRKSELFSPAGNIGFGYCSWNVSLPL